MTRPAVTGSAHLASEVSSLQTTRIPEPVQIAARRCILDLLGVMVAGACRPPSAIVADLVARDAANGPATVVGRGCTASTREAALANGVAAHVLDFDDVLPAMSGHPSSPVIPAALAVAEAQRSAGSDLIVAVVAGIELAARLGAAVSPEHYAHGFHATGTIGAIGAAAACARLLNLDPLRTEMAIGLAVAQSSGLKCMFGTMAKSFHVGHAAAAGVLAAELAAAGFTSCRDALGVEQGFAAAYADGANVPLLSAPFGHPWYILDVLFKLHAACYYTHATVEALLFVREVLGEAAVDAIELAVHPVQTTVCCIPEPATAFEGKFSVRFVAALALSRGHVNELDFTETSVRDPALVSLRDRVTVVTDPRLNPLACRATVSSRDGRVITVERDGDARGRRFDRSDRSDHLVQKFRSLVDPVLGQLQSQQLMSAVWRLGEESHVSDLVAALRGVRAATTDARRRGEQLEPRESAR